MPTGYTYYIESGKIKTAKEFLKICIRNFGCCIDQREESLDAPLVTKVEPNSYYRTKYEEALSQLEEWEKKSDEAVKEAIIQRKIISAKESQNHLSEAIALRKTYSKIREGVTRWKAPTAEHEGVKKFALQQIDISIPRKEDITRWIQECEELNRDLRVNNISHTDIVEYRNQILHNLQEEVLYYMDHVTKDVKRAYDRTEFLRVFLESLDGMEEDKQ